MSEEEIKASFIKFMMNYGIEVSLDLEFYFPRIHPLTLKQKNDYITVGYITEFYDIDNKHRFTLTDLGKEIIEPFVTFKLL